METQWTRMTANEAAEIIQHNDMVAFSGFTPAGSPKALPTAIARRANEQHEAKKPYQIRLLTGASISAAADDVLSDADAVSWRAPYQTSSGLRKKINQGAVSFVDLHLSEVAQMVNYGFFGDIDVAVIEASALAPDGRVWLTSGIGNAPTWLLRAKKVIIELNNYHDPRVAELADIVIPGAPPRRNSVSIFMAPSIAKEGKISTVVPMCSHVDHSEHSVKVIITEQGIADLRGLSPLQRARTIIDNCAHPMYRDYLHRYLENAPGGHIHHDLSHVFDLHRNLIATGSMLG
ncbi:TPA: hypothetical protein JEW44_000352 [Escherichia coli]|nr:hypothetical protein [Escherichia coli]